jgi:transposase
VKKNRIYVEGIPMRSKPYKAVDVKRIRLEEILEGREGFGAIVGVDVSKEELKLSVRWEDGEFDRPWKAKNPLGVGFLASLLGEVSKGRDFRVALEPSGTYGDPFRQALTDAGIEVHRVSPKHVFDYKEIFDGVPSQHDGKDGCVIADLSAQGRSWPWPYDGPRNSDEEMRFRVSNLAAHTKNMMAWTNRIEGQMGRYWPEALMYLKPSSSTLLHVLSEYGGPAGVAEVPEEAEKKVLKWSRSRISRKKALDLIRSAKETVGVRQTESNRLWIQEWALEALREQDKLRRENVQLRRMSEENEVIRMQVPVFGVGCACSFWVFVGDARNYSSGPAYRKAVGLNLKEKSSGKYRGELKITKRGMGLPRMYLYFAALRYLDHPAVQPWYEAKVERSNGVKNKAIVAIMRKLVLAAYHVGAKGATFDPYKLFDQERLSKRTERRRKSSS